MSSEVETRFLNYKFLDDSRWKEYSNNLYPTPTPEALEKIKKKWYKRNIDPDFDIDFMRKSSIPNNSSQSESTPIPEERKSNENNRTSGQQGDSTNNMRDSARENDLRDSGRSDQSRIDPSSNSELIKHSFYTIEGWLKIIFIISAFFLPIYANWIAFAISIMGWLRQCGRPQWNKEYGRKVIQNDFVQNILYMIPFAFFPGSRSLMYFFPLGMHFWIGASEFIAKKQPKLYNLGKKYIDITRSQTNELKLQKAKLEIFLIPYLIIMSFIGGQSFLLALFYGNFLRIKYIINQFTRYSFTEINGWINAKIMSNPSVPGILKMIIEKIRSFCGYLVKV